ncbi:hypothetical protein [Pseudomonas sp. Irchel 3E13]|uniref:hypothetical protein n=1 Tax=Pseudomonas sp. Irchel 3E13 TaxID=2008975 RepID=UPI000BA4E37C|nr:hypothetical protein [Pseudomonas sp. Irchel 3E13]
MQLNVITGPAGSGKTRCLREMATAQGMESRILNGSCITGTALHRQVSRQLYRGAKEVFIDECHPNLIGLIQTWGRRFPAGVVLHVVQQDRP